MDFENLEGFDPLERALSKAMRIFGILLALCVMAPLWVRGEGFVKLFGAEGPSFGELLPGWYTAAVGLVLLVLSFVKLGKDVKGIAAVALLLVLPLIIGVNLFELKDIEERDALRQLNLLWTETSLQTWLMMAGVVVAAAGMSLRSHQPRLEVGRVAVGAGVALVLAYFFLPTDAGMPMMRAIDSLEMATSDGFESAVIALAGPKEGPALASQMKLQVILRFTFYLIPVAIMAMSLPALIKKSYPGKAGGAHAGIVSWAWKLFIPAIYFPMAIKLGMQARSGEVFLGFARMYLITVSVLVVVPMALDAVISHFLAPNRGIPDLAEETEPAL
ncbi:MAG: hypothetical protein AMXMBFR64_03100 [Myxococcales bacterium]